MKKRLNVFALLCLGAAMILLAPGCKKDDTVAPTVTLKGNSQMTVGFGDAFTDPGATANDDTDGDLSSSIQVTGSVNTGMAGIYTLVYSVSDAAGNSGSAERTVEVVFDRDDYTGAFNCSENCQNPYGLASNPTLSAGATANQVVISPFYFNGGSLTLETSGSAVSVASGQSPNPVGAEVTGSGVMEEDGTGFTLNLTFTPQTGAPHSCTATYTK